MKVNKQQFETIISSIIAGTLLIMTVALFAAVYTSDNITECNKGVYANVVGVIKCR